MNSTLSQEQKDELRRSFLQSDFSLDIAIKKLTALGYTEEIAKQLIAAEFRAYKKELFNRRVNNDNNNQTREILFVAVVMLSMASPIFGIHSYLWHVAVIILSGIAGFYMFKSKPIAGIVGAITFSIVMPFAYNFYFSGRSTYINLEVLIPMLIAVAPAAIMYYLISFTVYANQEDN